MNTPEQPLRPELLDEFLSADLDGELDRAAAEHGYGPADVRAAVAATPGAQDRRNALVRARDQLAARPALAVPDEQRLVASALMRADEIRHARDQRAAGRRFERSRSVLVAVGSAAAVVAIIVGVTSIHPASESKSSSQTASAPLRPATPKKAAAHSRAHSGTVVFGDVSHSNALRDQVRAAVKLPATQSNADSAAPTTFTLQRPEPQGSQGLDSQKSAGSEAVYAGAAGLLAMAAPRGLVGNDGVVVNAPLVDASGNLRAHGGPVPAPAAVNRCTAAAARATPGSALVVTGTATYAGKPAVVFVYRQPPAYVAYVLSIPGCAVITHVAVP